MKAKRTPDSGKLKRIVALYNLVPNLFWSLVNLVPLTVFCYSFVDRYLLWCLVGISLLAALLPRQFFRRIQLSKAAAAYKRLGVAFVNRFTQNGVVVNGLIKRQYPGYRVVSFEKRAIRKLLLQSYMYEKFHFVFFVFFTLVTFIALIEGYFSWALLLSFCNVLYNVYPILLQQYVQVRITSATKV